ncbi:MAG: tripartite tricarboxylate transporter TctB family protein [Alphaproteobacteria bacterium]|nr:tripartite tricarboxylate transporter TctB family protein [Alphaproteobacteria bacterium]MBV1785845.1 tripartite tricarboxylate transporter TctB family protein [Hoeflea sp.]
MIGAVYLVFAYQLRTSALDDSVGPGGLPRTYGWLLLTLGLLIAAGALIKQIRSGTALDLKLEWKGQGRRIVWAGGLLAIGICYIAGVSTLGYPLAIALLLAAVALYQGARPGLHIAAIGIGGAAFLWAVFVLVLGVSMPMGLFAFL